MGVLEPVNRLLTHPGLTDCRAEGAPKVRPVNRFVVCDQQGVQVDSRLSKGSISAAQHAGGKDEDGSDDQEKNQKLSPAKAEAVTVAHSNTPFMEVGNSVDSRSAFQRGQ